MVLMLVVSIGTVSAQGGRVITGKVTDTNGEPIPGAAVFIEGTGLGVNADIDGKYTFKIEAGTKLPAKPILVFSFIGMKQEEVPLKDQKVINMVLASDAQLDEVVVTGYQSVSKRDMLGSYQQVKVEDLKMPSFSSIDQMLQGRVAGLVVTQTSSRVGASPDLKKQKSSKLLTITE